MGVGYCFGVQLEHFLKNLTNVHQLNCDPQGVFRVMWPPCSDLS